MTDKDKKIQDILDKIEEDNTSTNVDPVDTPFMFGDEGYKIPDEYDSIGYKKATRNPKLRVKNSESIKEEWLKSIQNISVDKKSNTSKANELFESIITDMIRLEKLMDTKNEHAISKYNKSYMMLEKLTNRLGYHFVKGNK